MNIKDELKESERRGVRWLKIAFFTFIMLAVWLFIWYVANGGNMESPFYVVTIVILLVIIAAVFGIAFEGAHYDSLELQLSDKADTKKQLETKSQTKDL